MESLKIKRATEWSNFFPQCRQKKSLTKLPETSVLKDNYLKDPEEDNYHF